VFEAIVILGHLYKQNDQQSKLYNTICICCTAL